jgi:hypothetical protein
MHIVITEKEYMIWYIGIICGVITLDPKEVLPPTDL